mgnify:CR=1 FL=1
MTRAGYRRITFAALVALYVIVITGSLVRLTGSGLGCSDWPRCSQEKFIDVSTGQVVPDQKPVYGRMYQTPFSDKIRNEVGIATMAVGNITEAEQVNQILLAGRADLVCLARPHLADPYWTLHQAIKAGDPTPWPLPYLAGRDQAVRLLTKAVEVARV